MKDQESVQKFIELRAQGVTFARIADQLGVAKSTLILWSRQHQHLIQNLRTWSGRSLWIAPSPPGRSASSPSRSSCGGSRPNWRAGSGPGLHAGLQNMASNCTVASSVSAVPCSSAPASNSPATMKPGSHPGLEGVAPGAARIARLAGRGTVSPSVSGRSCAIGIAGHGRFVACCSRRRLIKFHDSEPLLAERKRF